MRSVFSQLSIHKLEVFCLVAELGSISRAADRLCIAQPVVSGHVKSLSEKLGMKLITRSGRRIGLTEDGKRVHRWASDVVSLTLELEREIAESKQGIVGKAIVGSSMTLGSYVLPELLSAFRRQVPRGDISVRVTTPMQATDAVLAGDCDFAFTILDPCHDITGLEVTRVTDEQLILVSSPTMTFPPSGLSPGDLNDLPFVTAQSGTPRRKIEDNALARYYVRRNRIEMEFGHGEGIKHAVRSGAGLALLFRSSVVSELTSGALAEIALPQMDLRVPVYQVYRKGKKLSPFQQGLMSYIAGALDDPAQAETAQNTAHHAR